MRLRGCDSNSDWCDWVIRWGDDEQGGRKTMDRVSGRMGLSSRVREWDVEGIYRHSGIGVTGLSSRSF